MMVVAIHPPILLVDMVFGMVIFFRYLSSVVVLVCALRLLVSVLLLSACCVLAGWLCCVCAVHVFSLCFVASSLIGASAHVKPAAFSLPLSPLASCPVMVSGCTLIRLCTTRARARLCCGCGGWALLCFLVWLQLLWLRQLVGVVFAFPPCCCPASMASKVRGERRAAERAEREAMDRRVRQRLDEVEVRIEKAGSDES